MDEQKLQQWFEAIWADREERIYRDYFGDILPDIHPIPAATFQSLGHADPDPRFLTHAVLESPPNSSRPHWLYVSSGMSNPWGESPETIQPGSFSGLGFEFTMHARDRARWPIQILHWIMAVQLLVAAGQVQGNLLELHDRIPLGGPLWKKDGQLTCLLVAPPPEPTNGYPPSFQLASGRVDLMLLIGITTREADFAKTQGDEPLLNLLRHRDIFPLTDPERLSAI